MRTNRRAPAEQVPANRTAVSRRLYRAAPGEASDVELMPAGDVTEGVVRVGGTIRRPHQPQSFAVADYLDWLEDAGFEGSPRFLGRDAEGSDVLTFVPGDCAGAVPERWVQSEELLASVGRLLRRLHSASTGFVPKDHPFPPLGGGWARMWAEGVGGLIERRAAWLDANAARLVRALTG